MTIRLVLQRALLAGISVASIYFGVQNLRRAMAIGSLGSDPVTQWELRFQPVKKLLPFKRGVIGYITNSDVPGAHYDANNEQGEYTLTQYTMAPIILVRGDQPDWTLANLNSKAFQIWSQANRGQFRVIPLNDNLYLLHRLAP
ncbi:MAG TPA: hypothetical protein VLZ89_03450 [Anaerolineales bacterium]|nr:hypothetical protein [Anaerolineales bacterium]